MDIYTQITSDTPYDRGACQISGRSTGDAIREYCPILPYWIDDHARTDSWAGRITITDGCPMRPLHGKPDLEAYRLVEKDSNMSGSQILYRRCGRESGDTKREVWLADLCSTI